MSTPHFGVLFHFTHVDNLATIVKAGALLSDSVVGDQGLLTTEAGHQDIKERRRRMPVTCDPGGFVADYVPFYFAARSPMMLTISSGNVPSFTGDHRDLVYLVTDVNTVIRFGVRFAISDRNAAKALAEFANDVAVLGDLNSTNPSCDFVDWSIMNSTYWNNVPDYPDRMDRRMAEFLVHERLPLDALLRVAVHSARVKARVERTFQEAGRQITVTTEPGWYYA